MELQFRRQAYKCLRIGGFFSAVLLVFTSTSICAAQSLELKPFKASGVYQVGEKVGWTVEEPQGQAGGKFAYVLKENNSKVLQSGEVDLSSVKGAIEISLDHPAMLYLQVMLPQTNESANGAASRRPRQRFLTAGAAVAPTKLEPIAPRPADFDAFWEKKIAELKQVPPNPVLTPGQSDKPGVDYFTIKMDHVNGTHVYGQLARPAKEGKCPALVIFQWASPPYPLQKTWVTRYAAAGWLVLNIEPHDVLPDQPRSYYSALPAAIRHYESLNNDDRDKSYFVEMCLRDYRAIEYIAGRDDWDGKTLAVMGTSMGGQQSLCVAGLNSRITHLIVDEPAGCDTNASLHGRQMGYPNFPSDNPRVMETARYVDPINFASHIHATCLVAMGFIDTTAPPAGIWTAFNQIQGAKEAVPLVDSPHNNFATPAEQRPYEQAAARWLGTLVAGEQLHPEADRNAR